jgi:predicted transcriptional regulator of viral defense system
MAEERMKADYGSPVHGRIPEPVEILQKHTFAEKIRGRIVVRHEAKEPDAPIAIRDTFARISTIGRTFADTLSEPGWCGGMRHVLDVWQRHALTYLEEIVKAVDSSTRPIVKVRAGYILDELLGIKDARIDAWLAFAARGGSRKLDPDHSWLSRWSEKWMLSLNA